jgi:colanic acid/amylovoran biosynthesis protein
MSKTNKKTKIVIPFTDTLNTGDAAILLSTIGSIRREFGEEATIEVISHHSKIAQKHYPEVNYLQYKNNLNDQIFKKARYFIPRNYFIFFWQKLFGSMPKILLKGNERLIMNAIKSADIVISPGGGYLTDAYFIHFTLTIYNYALSKGKQLYFMPVSVGPLWKKLSINELKRIFNKSGAVILRDHQSTICIEELYGYVPDNIHELADEVFALKEPEIQTNKEEKHIGISVRPWGFRDLEISSKEGMNRFKTNIRNLCIHLISNKGFKITFISTSQGEDEYVDDSKLAIEIVESLDQNIKESITINREHHTPYAFLKEVSKFEFFVSVRMHPVILNFLNLTPCIGIMYEFKTPELFDRLGMNELAVDMHDPNPNAFIEKADYLIENKEKIQEIIDREIPKIRAIALKNMKTIYQHYTKR